MVALEGTAEGLIALAMPDGRNWLLKHIPQHALRLILPGAFMPEGGKTAGEDIAAGGNIGQRIGTTATRPRALTEVPQEAFQRCRGAGSVESNATLFARLLATAHKF